MKKGLCIIAAGAIFIGLLAGIAGCAVGPDNVRFTIRVTGPAGAEFDGSCTYVVKDLIGSRTLEAATRGTLTSGETVLEYAIQGTEISCTVRNLTPYRPITIVLLKEGEEVRRFNELGEGEANLAWYPPLTVDTKALEAKGYRYETEAASGDVIETGYFTTEEENKIARLAEKVPPETKQQFEQQLTKLKVAVRDPAYAVRSDPFWQTTEPYKEILEMYRANGDLILPLVFQHLDENEEEPLETYSLGSLMADIALQKYPEVLENIRYEDLHGRYTEDGHYILPYSATTMRLAKGLLAVL